MHPATSRMVTKHPTHNLLTLLHQLLLFTLDLIVGRRWCAVCTCCRDSNQSWNHSITVVRAPPNATMAYRHHCREAGDRGSRLVKCKLYHSNQCCRGTFHNPNSQPLNVFSFGFLFFFENVFIPFPPHRFSLRCTVHLPLKPVFSSAFVRSYNACVLTTCSASSFYPNHLH